MKPNTPTGIKVVNQLDINNAKRSPVNAITWTANTEPDISHYNIYRSYVPYGTFTKIAEVLSNVVGYEDQTTLTTSPSMPGDNSGIFQTIMGMWYYRISAVNTASEESDLSTPISYDETEAFDDDNLFSDGYILGDRSIGFAPDTACDMPDNEDMKYYFESIRNRNVWLLLQNGQKVWLYKRKLEGTKCPHWDSEIGSCKHPLGILGDGSDACYDTGLLGGYYAPVMARIRRISTPAKVIIEREGMRINMNPRGWTIWTPRLSNFDFIVTAEGHRFELTNVTQPVFRGGLITHQEFEMIEKWNTDLIWNVPVPGPLR